MNCLLEILKFHGIPSEKFVNTTLPMGFKNYSILDNAKLKKILDWSPKMPEDAIREILLGS